MSARGLERLARTLVAGAFALAVAGCGGGSSSGSPSTEPDASSPSTASPPGAPSASEQRSHSAEPSESSDASDAAGTYCTTGGSAASGEELAISDPGVSMRLPAGWAAIDMATYGRLLSETMGGIDDPRLQQATEWQLGLIRSNVMRAAAVGTSEPSGFQAVLIVSVPALVGDLETTVDTRLNDQATNGIPIVVQEVTATELPVGQAFCAGFTSDIEIGTPSQTIDYTALLPGGQAVSVGGTAPVGDSGFPDAVRSVALSLAAD